MPAATGWKTPSTSSDSGSPPGHPAVAPASRRQGRGRRGRGAGDPRRGGRPQSVGRERAAGTHRARRGYKRWNAAARALEGLQARPVSNYGTATDAHIWAARIDGELGRRNRSLDEYRIALADRPGDVALWIEYARAAETAGRDITAREAYAEAARLSPNSPDIASARQALEARSVRLRSPQTEGHNPVPILTQPLFLLGFPPLHGDLLVRRADLRGLPGGPRAPVSSGRSVGGLLLSEGRDSPLRLVRFRPSVAVSRTARFLFRGFGISGLSASSGRSPRSSTRIISRSPWVSSGCARTGSGGLRRWSSGACCRGASTRSARSTRSSQCASASRCSPPFSSPRPPAPTSTCTPSGTARRSTRPTWRSYRAPAGARVASTFAYVTGFGDFTIFVPTLLLSLGLDAEKPRVRRAALIGTLVSAAVVPMSGSRSSIVIGIAVLGLALWSAGLFFTRVGRRILVGAAVAATLSVVVFPDALVGVQSRFENQEETNTRFDSLRPASAGRDRVVDYPFMGIGTGCSRTPAPRCASRRSGTSRVRSSGTSSSSGRSDFC